MNIDDNKRHELNKVFIDFGTIEDAEYDILCMTAFTYQGRPQGNHAYEEVSAENGDRLFKRTRIASAFEFPSNAWCDAWLKELPRYFEPPKPPKTTRKKSVTPVKMTASI
jgi:hypothetical protein